jgi:mono/diheme cytochrome c family protein
MKSRALASVVPVVLTVLLAAPGCAKKEPQEPAAAGPQEAASSAAPAAVEATPAEPAAPAEAVAPAAAPAEAPATATAAASGGGAGEQVFKTFCVTCHGVSGHGDGPASAGLNPKPASFADNAFKYDVNGNGTKGDIEDITAIVHDGAAKHGGSPLMTPWPMLSPEQLQAVAAYVKAFSGS